MKSIVVALILLLGILQYEFWFSDGGLFSVLRLKHRITQQNLVNQKMKERNLALLTNIQELKKGGAAVEDRARNELGMVKKGEVFYQVIMN